jgi:hypothetical protein
MVLALPAFAIPVSVTVVDQADTPVTGAKVWFQTPELDKTIMAITDEQGTATADLPVDADAPFKGRAVAQVVGKALGGATLLQKPTIIKLSAPVTLTGLTVDIAGKPVANVPVRLSNLYRPSPRHETVAVIGEGPEWDAFTVRSDANGQWKFSFLPAGATANYELLDAHYVRIQGKQELPATGTAEATPLVARPGAIITGRVVDEAGKPLAAVSVTASSRAMGAAGRWDNTITGKDGAYRLTRLGTGSFEVRARLEGNAARVAAPITNVQAKENEVAKAPDLIMTPGALVDGVVTDAATGTPLKGVYVSVPGNSTITSADGRYSARALPGDGNIYIMGKPPTHLYPKLGSPSNTMPITLAEGQTKTVSFVLPPALQLTGRVVDEAGGAAGGATVLLSANHSWDQLTGVADEEGAFEIVGLEPGEFKVAVRGDWTVVGPDKVTLPLQAPLVVKLRRTPLLPLRGRVIDDKGKPVLGVQVTIHESIPVSATGSIGSSRKVSTDAEGYWQWTPSQSNVTATVSAGKTAYRFVSGGKLTRGKDILGPNGLPIPNPTVQWEVSDIVLQPLVRTAKGRVLGADGKPVTNAIVAALAGGASGSNAIQRNIAVTDATGNYSLADLPEGEVAFVAGEGNSFARISSAATTLPDMVLQPQAASGPNLAQAREVVRELIEASRGTRYYARSSLAYVIAPYDTDAAIELAGAARDDGKAQPGTVRAIVTQLMQVNPVLAQEKLPELLRQMPAPTEGYVSEYFAVSLIPFMRNNPDVEAMARSIFETGRAAVGKLDFNASSDLTLAYRLVGLALLAVHLNEPGAEALVDSAVAIGMRHEAGQKETSGGLGAVIEGLARSNIALIERALEKIPADNRAYALGRVVPELAQTDLAGALRLLEQIPGTSRPEGSRLSNADPTYAFGLAAKPIIARLQHDPAAALALARRVTSESHRSEALALAAQWQPKEEGKKLLREAFTMPGSEGEGQLMVAAIALRVDPALAQELLQSVENHLLSEDDGDRWGSDRRMSLLAALGFYLAQVAPGRSQALLEWEWARLLTSSGDRNGSRNSRILAMAMVAVNAERALEMARSIPPVVKEDGSEDFSARFEAQRKIAQYMVAPEAVQRTIRFDRWGASDTWTPGTETGW